MAGLTSHPLGLAVDFVLPVPPGEGGEAGVFRLSTKPVSRGVDVRRPPVDEWLHPHADAFGWRPFQREPRHREHNPPGFRSLFFDGFPGGPPPRAALEPEAG